MFLVVPHREFRSKPLRCYIRLALQKIAIYAIVLLLVGCIKNIDRNPLVASEKLAGEYNNSEETLLINIDNTYTKKSGMDVDIGHWSVRNSSLTLISNDKKITHIKVYEVDGVYQLIIKDRKRQDPDTYNWARAMNKKSENKKGHP